MITTYIQIVMGTIALITHIASYVQAMIMASVNRRINLNGSSGAAVRTLKRRAVLQMLISLMIILSGVYVIVWLRHLDHSISSGDRVIMLRSFSFTVIAFVLMLNTVWDMLDRKNVTEYKMHEDARLKTQKRAVDPEPGQPLPPEELQKLAAATEIKETS